MKRSLFLVLCVLTMACGASAQTPTGLTRLLDAELTRFPAKAGVYVKHLGTGEEAAVRGDERFHTLSVIKIPVMVLAFQLSEQKKLNLHERVEIRKEDLRGGSGIFSSFETGLNPTILDIITQMIIVSDNSATDIMVAKVGGLDAVNAWLQKNGYVNTKMDMTTQGYFSRRTGPPGTFEQRLKFESDPANWLGVTTPREGMGRMLEGIEKGTIASKESCAEMKRIMLMQKSGQRRIPHFLDVRVAHKTGDGPPFGANDVGMVYANSGAIVISFFNNENRGPFAELEDDIGRVSRMIVEYFDGTMPTPRPPGR